MLHDCATKFRHEKCSKWDVKVASLSVFFFFLKNFKIKYLVFMHSLLFSLVISDSLSHTYYSAWKQESSQLCMSFSVCAVVIKIIIIIIKWKGCNMLFYIYYLHFIHPHRDTVQIFLCIFSFTLQHNKKCLMSTFNAQSNLRLFSNTFITTCILLLF